MVNRILTNFIFEMHLDVIIVNMKKCLNKTKCANLMFVHENFE